MVTPGSPAAYRPPATTAIMAVNVIAFIAQFLTADRITNDGLLFGPLVADGEVWRVVTSGFLHDGLLHIGFNMYALWLFGRVLERGIGTVRFLLVYLASLLGGSVAVLAFNYAVPTLGASAAVLGLAGGIAGVMLARGRPLQNTGLVGLFVINLALPILVPGISFWGHLGGIVAGFVAGGLLAWLPDRAKVPDSGAMGVVGLLIVALFGACLFLASAGI